VIGDPVEHSRSPAMHNAAFAALGLDWVYVAFRTAPDRGEAAVRAVLDLGLSGLNVTMPHKAPAAAACDELAPEAGVLGAVNTVVVERDRLVGHNTDGSGFLHALADESVAVDAKQCLVLGAGGAARAIALALADAGAVVTVAARRVDAARAAADLARGAAVAMAEAPIEECDVLVNATPLGMRDEAPPFDAERLRSGQFVFDTVYPGETPLLEAARAAGATAAGGLGMLVHQGALAFRLWTGRAAPVEVMRAAALDA
jgi:shikimate dehydrogenase